jgi:hypothetical protein
MLAIVARLEWLCLLSQLLLLLFCLFVKSFNDLCMYWCQRLMIMLIILNCRNDHHLLIHLRLYLLLNCWSTAKCLILWSFIRYRRHPSGYPILRLTARWCILFIVRACNCACSGKLHLNLVCSNSSTQPRPMISRLKPLRSVKSRSCELLNYWGDVTRVRG